MSKRSGHAERAQETIKIYESGQYIHPDTDTLIRIPSVDHAVAGTVYYRPQDIVIPSSTTNRFEQTTIRVTCQQTLEAA